MKRWKVSPEDDKKQIVVIQRLQEPPERLAALVKLSDRLDNIRRLRFADGPGKREHYILQTESLYIPFAKRTNEYLYQAILHTLQKLNNMVNPLSVHLHTP
jgi:(p)ppGpp synthase/HD superfamily hydrolase